METSGQAPTAFDLYLTHVQADEKSLWLKVWGQRNTSITGSIEELLCMMKPVLDSGQLAAPPSALSLNQLYCARFTEDLKWYRVCVTDLTQLHAGNVVVRFVDYGNTDVVNVELVRPLSPLLANYPPQASEYIVSGVVPAGNAGWTQEALAYSREMICYEDGVTVREVDSIDGLPAIRIKIIGAGGRKLSFNRQIVIDGHARKMTRHGAESVSLTPSPPVAGYQNQASTLPIGGGHSFTSIPLQWPMTLPAFVVHVDSPSNFYIHVAHQRSQFSFDALQTEIGYYLRSITNASSYPFSLQPGDSCVAVSHEKGRVCRGSVSSIAGNGCILKIFFVDFGNLEEKSPLEVFPCQPTHLQCPSMAIRVSLDGVAADSANLSAVFTALKSLDENQQVQCQVLEPHIGGKSYRVRILLKAGIDLSELPPARAVYKRPGLEAGQKMNVIVTWVLKPDHFYVRLHEYEDRYRNMHGRLQEFCNSAFSTVQPPDNWWEEGTPLCVQRTEDRAWYRGEAVCKISSDLAMVQLVDIGLSEVTHVSNVLAIAPFLVCNLPILAHRCCLRGFQGSRPVVNNATEKMRLMTDNKVLEMHVDAMGVDGHSGTASVNLVDHSVKPSAFVNLMLNYSMQTWDPESITIAVPELKKIETVFVTACDSLSNFFGQLVKFPLADLDRLQMDLNAYYDQLHSAQKQLKSADAVAGRFCCTKFSEDEMYYRSRILAKDNKDMFTIQFVDYGNVERKKLCDIKMLLPEFTKLPRIGIRCRCVDNVFPGINPNAIRSALLEKNAELEIQKCSDDDVFLVRFVNTSQTNSDVLRFISDESLSPQPTASISTASSLMFREMKLELQENMVVVYFKSPFQFWCQPLRLAQDLRELMDAIDKYANSKEAKPLTSPAIDRACLALFSIDETWYRGLIRSVQSGSSKVEVEFVDYGNVETLPLSAVLTIPPALMSLPRQGIECSLPSFPKKNLTTSELAAVEEKLLNTEVKAKILGNSTKPQKVEFMDGLDQKILEAISPNPATRVSPTRPNESSWNGCSNADTSKNWRRGNDSRGVSRDDKRDSSRDSWRQQQQDLREKPLSQNDTGRRSQNGGGGFETRSQNAFRRADEGASAWRTIQNGENEDWGSTRESNQAVTKSAGTQSTPKEFRHLPSTSLIGLFKDIFVCNVISPSEFYCNLTEYGASLKQLCIDLHTHFADAGQACRLPIADVRAGTACCAKFSEDGRWYRAVIKSVAAGGSSAVVQYVDYGSEETVTASNLLRLDDEHVILPTQALKCAMHDARPFTGDSWTLKDRTNFQERVMGVPLLAQFVEQLADESYSVRLVDVLQLSDLKNELVIEGQARPKLTNSSLYRETVASKIKSPFTQPAIESGAMEKVRVVWVSHPAQFFCHLLRDEVALAELEKNLNDIYGRASSGDFLLSNAQPDMACVSVYQGAWYRACIIEVDKDTLVLFYVDYGNIERVASRDVRSLKSEFMQLPYQAVKCQLRGIRPAGKSWAKLDASRLQEYYGGGVLEATFHAHCDGCFMVDVTKNGKSVAHVLVADKLASLGTNSHSSISRDSVVALSPVGIMDTLPPVLPVPQALHEKVFVSFVETPNLFWVQKASDESAITQLLSALFEAYDGCEGTSDYEAKVDDLCAAYLSSDDNWYRAKVISFKDQDSLDVQFIDYGNTEQIKRVDVLALKSQFRDQLPFAIPCMLPKLADVPTWPQFCIDVLREFTHAGESPVEARFLEKRGNVTVVSLTDAGREAEDLFADRRNNNEASRSTGSVAVPQQSLSPFVIPSTNKWEAICTFIYSPHRFYLQDATREEAVIALTERLLSEHDVEFDLDFAQGLNVGEYCVAHYSNDDGWYRAKLMNKSERTVSLHFIDFGNDETVDICELRPMRKQDWVLPIMSIECQLPGVDSLCSETLSLATQRFNELIDFGEKVVEVEVMKMNGQKLTVKLIVDGVSIAEVLTKATPSPLNLQPAIIPLGLSEGMELTVVVSHIKSLSQFWIQRAADAKAINQFQKELCDYYALDNVLELADAEQYDGLYAAKIDGSWFRVTVFSHWQGTGETATVQLIDFGIITEVSTEQLRKLAFQFADVAAFSAKCTLVQEDEGGADTDAKCTALFISVLQEPGLQLMDIKICVLKKMTTDGAYLVNMTIGRTSVHELLQDQSVGITGNTVGTAVQEFLNWSDFPLGQKVAVAIVHMISPSEFYLQRVGTRVDLLRQTFLSELLESCEAATFDPDAVFKVGDLCAARFSDRLFYRALIMTSDDGGYQASFIDFGNRDVVSFEDLRHLSSKFVDVPAFCRRCCLAGLVAPESNEWSSEAIDAFRELVKDGKGTLLAVCMSPEDQLPSEVRLLEMGMDVAEAMVNCGLAAFTPEFESIKLANALLLESETSEPVLPNFDEKIVPGVVCNGVLDDSSCVLDVGHVTSQKVAIEAGLIVGDDDSPSLVCPTSEVSLVTKEAILERAFVECVEEEFGNPSLESSPCDHSKSDEPSKTVPVITGLILLETIDLDDAPDFYPTKESTDFELQELGDKMASTISETDLSILSARKYEDPLECDSSELSKGTKLEIGLTKTVSEMENTECKNYEEPLEVAEQVVEEPLEVAEQVAEEPLDVAEQELEEPLEVAEQVAEEWNGDVEITNSKVRKDSGSPSSEASFSPPPTISHMWLSLDKSVPVVLSSVTSPSEFWVTFASDVAELRCLRKELNSFYKDSPTLSADDLSTTTTFVVQDVVHDYSRAVLLPFDDGGRPLLHLIDYGSVTPLGDERLCAIYPRHLSPPRLATKCSLRLTRIQEEELDKVDLHEAFCNVVRSIGQGQLTMVARERLADGYAVDLFLDDVNVYELLALTDLSDYESCISSETQLLETKETIAEDALVATGGLTSDDEDSRVQLDEEGATADAWQEASFSEQHVPVSQPGEPVQINDNMEIKEEMVYMSCSEFDGEQLLLAKAHVVLPNEDGNVTSTGDEHSLNDDMSSNEFDLALGATNENIDIDADDSATSTILQPDISSEPLEVYEVMFVAASEESKSLTDSTEGSFGKEKKGRDQCEESINLFDDFVDSSEQLQEEPEDIDYFEVDPSNSDRLKEQVRFTHAFHHLAGSIIEDDGGGCCEDGVADIDAFNIKSAGESLDCVTDCELEVDYSLNEGKNLCPITKNGHSSTVYDIDDVMPAPSD